MRLRTPRRGGFGSDDSVIPMINVVFLLLVFFMVAGTIRPTDPIRTQLPESTREGAAPTAPRVLHLGADGALALDGESLVLADLAQALALSGAPEVSGEAGAAGGEGPGSTIREGDVPLALRADASVPFVLVREAIDAIRAAGVQRVELIIDPVPAPAPASADAPVSDPASAS